MFGIGCLFFPAMAGLDVSRHGGIRRSSFKSTQGLEKKMKKEIPHMYPDQQCLFCGEKNPIGLKLKFSMDDETGEVSTEYTPTFPFVGQGNILHGGILAGLLDEIMGWTSHYLSGRTGVTSELKVTFLKPVFLGKRIWICCRISSRNEHKTHLEARIETLEGSVCSRATSTYRLLSSERFHDLIHGGK